MKFFFVILQAMFSILFRSVDNTADANQKYQMMRKLDGLGGILSTMLARYIKNRLNIDYQLAIPFHPRIGDRFIIKDPLCVRIGQTTEIGNDCIVYSGFSSVAAVKGDENREGQRRHPKIGDRCVLGGNSTVIGTITIGDDVTIMPCSIVTKDVLSCSIVSGTNNICRKEK